MIIRTAQKLILENSAHHIQYFRKYPLLCSGNIKNVSSASHFTDNGFFFIYLNSVYNVVMEKFEIMFSRVIDLDL